LITGILFNRRLQDLGKEFLELITPFDRRYTHLGELVTGDNVE
jgi:hypothetical protein